MYREVTMLTIRVVLRLWLAGKPKKRVVAQLGLDPKTVRHSVAVAEGTGLRMGGGLRERTLEKFRPRCRRQRRQRVEIPEDEEQLPGDELRVNRHGDVSTLRRTYSRSIARNRRWSWYRLNA